MSQVTYLAFALLSFVCFSNQPCSGRAEWRTVNGQSAEQIQDEAKIRAIIERFLAAYQKKDIDGLMLDWSQKAPGIDTEKQALQQMLSADPADLRTASIDLHVSASGR
jgi:hypothetical protein